MYIPTQPQTELSISERGMMRGNAKQRQKVKKKYWNRSGNKLTHFKRIGHDKNMLKGNQCCTAKCLQQTATYYYLQVAYGACDIGYKSVDLQLFRTVPILLKRKRNHSCSVISRT